MELFSTFDLRLHSMLGQYISFALSLLAQNHKTIHRAIHYALFKFVLTPPSCAPLPCIASQSVYTLVFNFNPIKTLLNPTAIYWHY